MRSKYGAKMNLALKKTVQAYQKLIRSPHKSVGRWRRYGQVVACRLCRVTYYCEDCPLDGGALGCATSTMTRLQDQIRWYNKPGMRDTRDLVRAAKARLKWIKARAKENGAKL